MKVLQINKSVNTGSTGRITEEIGQKLIDQGHNSYIAYSTLGSNGSSSNLIKIGNKIDVYMHGLKTRLFDLHGFGSKHVTRNLISKIDDINPDVIGLHNLHGYYLNVEVLFNYLKKSKLPVIWTLFDCWAFTGHCTYFESIGCERWIDGCYACPKKNSYPASYGLDNSKNNYKNKRELFTGLDNLTIVTHSEWLRDLVKRSFLKEYPVKVIRSGVDLKTFDVNKDTPDRIKELDKKVILGVANLWNARKGLNTFLQLNNRLDDSYQIVLIGLSDKQKASLPENVIGLSRTENVEQLASYYKAADVFVNPTTADNFPTTNLEALACGTPVVTYNTGGSPEAVDEDTGSVVCKGNFNKLVKAINSILEGDKTLYIQKCRERAEKLFNKEDRYQDYLDLMLSVKNKSLV
ncbi:MAG: glycosyltransferase [Balneolaceae bacterium]|nr:glycosyltransferase [Balneolaceae bacterium]